MELIGYNSAHKAFISYMQKNAPNGESFVSFDHPFIYSDEIKYKRQVHSLATDALRLNQWNKLIKTPGLIIDAVKDACSPSNSANLLDHRYGESGPYKSLYRVNTKDDISELENELNNFFKQGSTNRDKFGPRFDRLAEYLRKKRLGANWSFIAYLAYLADHRRYFPILPTQFDILLEYYGIQKKISGYVSWDRYSVLLDLSEELRERLIEYGPVDMISIQSYMWVVSGLIKHDKLITHDKEEQLDFLAELNRRKNSAIEQERIGLKGEKLVFEQQINQLKDIGRDDLAVQVNLVSNDPGHGFDVLSYTDDGTPIHIEVKSTTRSRTSDYGFWLSENERKLGEQDDFWTVFRVWDIDVEPIICNIGNVINDSKMWELSASNWFVKKKNI